ncbi:hypothetical protein N7523_005388 [Penicillium sp. IBT 18751x]|nr:hypothetical protein N7523_005388 [Penicillium sp. IBT 18751x]
MDLELRQEYQAHQEELGDVHTTTGTQETRTLPSHAQTDQVGAMTQVRGEMYALICANGPTPLMMFQLDPTLVHYVQLAQ